MVHNKDIYLCIAKEMNELGFIRNVYQSDEFRHASVNRTSDPGPTRINESEALVWTWPKKQIEAKLHKLCHKGQCLSVESEKYTCQNGHIPL